MQTARVIRWLKRPGDRVRMGEALVEVETDKATMEVESPADGVLTEVLIAEGEDVAVAGALGRLRTEEHSVSSSAPQSTPAGSSDAKPASPAAVVEPAAAAASRSAREPARAAGERIRASPLARRLAAEAGLDLQKIQGTGPDQRVRRRDVERIRAARDGGAAARVRPLSPMRARIAEAVAASRKTIPSYSLDRWVETAHLTAVRAGAATRANAARITFTDLLLQALADTLAQTPAMLERWLEEGGRPAVTSSSTIDIGLVVAVEQGLLIPTLRNVANRDLGQIASLRAQAVERARAGRLAAGDHEPASIALSNLGKSGVDRFEAIISPGQSSILAVGREHERALAHEGRLYAALGVNLTLSVDHRLIDGRMGAEFLGLLAQRIERGPWRGA